MRALVMAAVFAGGGLGVVLVVAGVAGYRVVPERDRERPETSGQLRVVRVVLVVLAALAVWVLTSWPVVSVAVLVAGLVRYARPAAAGADDDVARARAIARWTRMVRDTISGSTAIQQALEATAPVAPKEIRPALLAFEARVRQVPLLESLELLRRDLDHPAGDVVVVCLQSIVREGTEDAGALLARLAATTESGVRMRQRIEASRAGNRTAMRQLVGIIVVGVAAAKVFMSTLLEGYSTFFGQVWLAVVCAVFALGGWLMTRYTRFDAPERLSARTGVTR